LKGFEYDMRWRRKGRDEPSKKKSPQSRMICSRALLQNNIFNVV
jgi:hypothetical protein